jgi:hypothetical protein
MQTRPPPSAPNPSPKLKRFEVGGKIIKLPFSVWKDGRLRVDVSAYGKGEIVSRNKSNLVKRVREFLANALAETDELLLVDSDPQPRQRNRRVSSSSDIATADQLVFFRPADYKREFSNCPRPVDRMIGPTHLEKRLFGFLWSEAKQIGLDFCLLIFASAARELGATEFGIKKSAYSLRDDWKLIWFDGKRQKPGPQGGAAVKFPHQDWMGPIPQHSCGTTRPNPQQNCGEFRNADARNPQHSFGTRLAGAPTDKKEKREKSTEGGSYKGPDW